VTRQTAEILYVILQPSPLIIIGLMVLRLLLSRHGS